MHLPCPSCETEVPEGASQCPSCGAGLRTLVEGKKKQGLTRTMIGRAIELRQSIPWARASAVVMLDDPYRPGKKKVRTGARNGLVLLGVAACAVGAYYLLRPRPEAAPALGSATPQVTVQPAEEKPARPPPPVAAPAKAERPAPAPVVAVAQPKKPPEALKAVRPGTLVVTALFKGKPLPGARVLVNGENKGKTPLAVPMPPGKFTVKVELAGFKTEKRTDVEILSNRKATLLVELKK